MSNTPPISISKLDARIRGAWLRIASLNATKGLLTFVHWAIPLLLISIFLDWMTFMPSSVRGIVLALASGTSLYHGWQNGWRHLRLFNAVDIALTLESKHGNLNSLLVSAVQLSQTKHNRTGSKKLREHTCKLAELAAAGLNLHTAFPLTPLRRSGAIAGAFTAVFFALSIFNQPFLSAGISRFFTPWLEIEYPTRTQITINDDEIIVKEGDRASIVAEIRGEIPTKAVIEINTGDESTLPIELDIRDGSCTYSIASASRDFRYRINAGDDRTKWHKVKVITAPSLEEVHVEIDYPSYLQKEKEVTEALTLTVPEGSKIQWRLSLDRPVQSAKLIRDGDEPIDVEITEDHRSAIVNAHVSASKGYRFRWVDKEHHFVFDSPRYFLQVSSDQAPRVEITSPDANLVAMVGRPWEIAVRLQDDHGIAQSNIAYRINQREEVSLHLDPSLQSKPNEQIIDWDYRKDLKDLRVGDTVSVAIEVSDRYPQPLGPHIVRSETRRITFLSEEKYLEQIRKQQDRLLSRIEAIYRKQRTAFDNVVDLESNAEGYKQACQLEAIRQEMIRNDLRDVANQMQHLLDDLSANGLEGIEEVASLTAIKKEILDIAETHIAEAATRFRDQSSSDQPPISPHAENAASAVNEAARDLGALVMLRGIDSAQEVYARETRMLAKFQGALRWQTIVQTEAIHRSVIAEQQAKLAQWTQKLIDDLQSGLQYQERPLAVLRLTRSIKNIRSSGTIERMQTASTLIVKNQNKEANTLQSDLVRTLLDAEFSVRLSGAYSTLLQTRDLIRTLADLQEQLLIDITKSDPDRFRNQRDTFKQVQQSIRKQLITMMLPTVPAPRAGLFDEKMPQPPPVQNLLQQADEVMAEISRSLEMSGKQKIIESQTTANQLLIEVVNLVDRWSVDMGLQTQGVGTLVASSSQRMTNIEEFESRVIGILERTDLTALEEQTLEPLIEPQRNLADEISGYLNALRKENGSDPDLPPLITQLDEASDFLELAVQALQENNAESAILNQEKSADALASAFSIVVAQNERLSLLQDLLLFQRSVGFANGYMSDIVAEQNDLLEQTEASEIDAMKSNLPQFRNMLGCINNVSPLLDMVAARLDVGTPLAFAMTDFEDAILAIETGDKFDAVDAQDVAAESLGDVQLLVEDITVQTGYIAEVVDFLHGAVSDITVLQHRQSELHKRTITAKPGEYERISELQQQLLSDAVTTGETLLNGTGMESFKEPAEIMQEALEEIKSGQVSSASDAMELVTEIYAENTEELLMVITMLHGLPSIEVLSDSDPALVRLVEALALASDHKQLYRQTQQTSLEQWNQIQKKQELIAKRLKQILVPEDEEGALGVANQKLSQAIENFVPDKLLEIRELQRVADEKMRHYIVEQSIILETAAPVAAPSEGDGDSSEGSDSESALSAGFISDFVSGEAVRDKRSEWKVLGDRNRAALNQNFARELPLEYRALLKNYYERVAQ